MRALTFFNKKIIPGVLDFSSRGAHNNFNENGQKANENVP